MPDLSVLAHLDRLKAGPGLLHVARLPPPLPAGDRDRGAQRRVPREGELLARRPDPVEVVGAPDRRRLHEGRLREAGLAREGEHHLLVDPVGVVDDREPVADQRALGEYVQEGDAARHRAIFAQRPAGVRCGA